LASSEEKYAVRLYINKRMKVARVAVVLKGTVVLVSSISRYQISEAKATLPYIT
jgi:hypothetical protein